MPRSIASLSLFLCLGNLLVLTAQASTARFTTSCFVTPAVPNRVAPVKSMASPASQLGAKKKAPVAAATKKIQVKLLKHIAGTGQAGQVIMVTPAFFNNKLRPTKSAVIISDEEVQKEQMQAAEADKQARETAEKLKEQFANKKITIKRKVGPDGQLFGGIGPKVIMEEVQSMFGEEEEFLSRKSVKVTSLLDASGKKITGDIKHTGEFGAMISLTQDISAKIKIEVEGE